MLSRHEIRMKDSDKERKLSQVGLGEAPGRRQYPLWAGCKLEPSAKSPVDKHNGDLEQVL